MVRSKTFASAALLVAGGALAVTMACSNNVALTPTPPEVPPTPAQAGGVTLKASAPGVVSPGNNDTIGNEQPTLVITPAAGNFTSQPFFYEFQITDDAGALVRQDTIEGLQWPLPLTLGYSTAYRWRARAVLNGQVGPWSNQARFVTPNPPAVGKPTRNASGEEWRKWFEAVRQLRNVGPTVSNGALAATRADLLSVEADWQNGWRGDLRARIFLPVPGCNPTAANNPSPPACAFNKTVDVGNIGQTWQWIER